MDQQVGNGRTDGLSIAAMICGILAVVGVCCWPIALILAILAIVFGHVSKRSIRASQGGKSGLGMAKAGCILGYVSLVLIAALVAYGMFTKGISGLSPWEELTSDRGANMNAATEWVDERLAGGVSGNSPAAIELAESFAQLLVSMNDDALAVDRNELIVWCELRPDKCAVVVQYAPVSLFEKKKRAFQQRCWQALQRCLQPSPLPDQAEVAVATRGIISFSDIFLGRLVKENNADGTDGLRDSQTSDPGGESLLTFFTSDEPD